MITISEEVTFGDGSDFIIEEFDRILVAELYDIVFESAHLFEE
jgi:hypothetical protein